MRKSRTNAGGYMEKYDVLSEEISNNSKSYVSSLFLKLHCVIFTPI